MLKYLKIHWIGCLYSILLIGFTVYMFMDTFLISKVYRLEEKTEGQNIIQEKSRSGEEQATSETEAEISETSYEDGQISVTLTEYCEADTTVYVADILLSSSEYLKTAFAQNSYGKNVTEKTSEMAARENAVLAINGDYYGAQEKGYVLRSGKLYRSEAEKGQEDLVIYQDGTFEIISEEDIAAEELLEQGAQEILSFGPGSYTRGRYLCDRRR